MDKASEEQISRSEKRIRSLLRNSLDNITLMSADGKLLWESPTTESMLGYEPNEFRGRNLFELMHSDDLPWVQKQFGELVRKPGARQSGVFRLRSKDGTWRWIEAVVTNLLDEPDLRGMVVNYRDVTERKLAEDAAREEREMAEALRDIAAALNQSLDFEEVLDRILQNLERVVPLETADIALLENKTVHIVRTRGYERHNVTDAVARSIDWNLNDFANLKIMWETQQPRIVSDTQQQSDWVQLEPFEWVRSSLGAPICAGGRVLGFIRLASERPGFYTQIHAGRLQAFADQAAIALRNADLMRDTQESLKRLTVIHSVDNIIAGSFDLHFVLNAVLETLVRQMDIGAADILLFNTYLNALEWEAGFGFMTETTERPRLRYGKGFPGRVVVERQIVHVPELNESDLSEMHDQVTSKEGFVSYYGIPLVSKGKAKGILELFYRRLHDSDPDWLDFLRTVAGQIAIAVDDTTLFNNLQRSNYELTLAYEATIEGWSRALDLRDKETEGHTQRVAELTVRLARNMGVDSNQLTHIQRGALLHDIGKMGVPDNILLKPGPLTEEEWVLMRKHPTLAYEMLSPIAFLRPALDIPYCHHEKWDGSGYPRGLKGKQIPLGARVFAVIDVWDALTSDRPYREAWPREKARKYIEEAAGTHFDPEVVTAFLQMLDSET